MPVDGDDQELAPEIAEALIEDPVARTHRQEAMAGEKKSSGLTSVPSAEEIDQALDDRADPEQPNPDAVFAEFAQACPIQQPMPVALLVRPEVHGGGSCPCRCGFPQARGFVLLATGSPTGLTYTYLPAENAEAIAKDVRDSGAKATRAAMLAVPVAVDVSGVPGAASATLLG